MSIAIKAIGPGRYEVTGRLAIKGLTRDVVAPVIFKQDGGTTVASGNLNMQNADMFDVAAHPTARFESTAVKFDGDKLAEVQGRLTLKGKTHPITLSARQFRCYDNPMLKRQVCGGDFEATIDRTQWDLGYRTQMGMVKDVRLLITAEGVRE